MDKMKVYRIYYNNENIITIRATKLEIEKTEALREMNFGWKLNLFQILKYYTNNKGV